MLVFAPQERTQRNGSAKQWRLVHREPGFVYIVADWLRSFPGRGRSTWPSCLGIRPKTASSQRDILCIYKRTRFAFFIWVLQYAVLHTTCEKSKKLAYMFHWLSDTHKTLTSLTTTLPRGRNSWCEHVSNMHRYYTRIPMFHKPWVLVYHLSPLFIFCYFSIFSFSFENLFWQIRESVRKSRDQPTQHPWPFFTLQAHGRRRALRHRGRGGGATSLGRRVEGQGTLKLMNGIGIEFKFGSFVFIFKKMSSNEKFMQDHSEDYFEEEVWLLCINIAKVWKIQKNTSL